MKSKTTVAIFLLICLTLLLSSANIFSQPKSSDGSFYQQALANATAVYHHSFGNQSALYNGGKYAEYPFLFKDGHPFFNLAAPVAGSVVYDGILYDSVMMRYDETKDVLVINSQLVAIQLLSERVHQFSLYQSDFIRLVKDSLSSSLVSTGFYNRLYSGNEWLLKKQVKTVRESISPNNELQRFVDEKDHYYLKKDGIIYSVKTKKDFFKLLGSRKKEVQQFIKANKLSFRKGRQDMLTRATAYYDSLKK